MLLFQPIILYTNLPFESERDLFIKMTALAYKACEAPV